MAVPSTFRPSQMNVGCVHQIPPSPFIAVTQPVRVRVKGELAYSRSHNTAQGCRSVSAGVVINKKCPRSIRSWDSSRRMIPWCGISSWLVVQSPFSCIVRHVTFTPIYIARQYFTAGATVGPTCTYDRAIREIDRQGPTIPVVDRRKTAAQRRCITNPIPVPPQCR